jgi:hypothetical protein
MDSYTWARDMAKFRSVWRDEDFQEFEPAISYNVENKGKDKCT